MKKLLFLVLNIYTLNSVAIQAQDLHLKITAENEVQTKVIDSLPYTKTHASFKLLSAEVDSAAYRLQKKGYISLVKQPIIRRNDTLFTATFVLNKKYDSISIRLPKGGFNLKDLLRVDDKASEERITIPIAFVETVLSYLNSIQTKSGGAFSTLQLSKILVTDGLVTADLVAETSTKREIDNIIIKGYDKFPRPFIHYGARLKKGQIFNKEILEQRAALLNNLSFATTKKSPEVLFTRDSTSVYLYLEKKKANAFDGFLGFSNNPETNALELNGYLDLSLTNNLNYGETLNLTYKADGGEQVQFKANLDLPYLFKTPVGVLLDLEIFKRDSTFVTIDQAARLNYQITNNANVFLGYKGTTSNNLQEEVIVGSTVEDFTSRFLNIGGQLRKSTADQLFPLKYRLGLNAQIGSRETDFNKDNQIRGTLQGHYIFNLNARNSIFFSNTASALFTENTLPNELFRFGGILSVRGFEENSIDASLLNAIQTEYRYLLSSNLYTHTVFDYAYYENDVIELKQQLLSVGFGLGLITNAGLLKVVFANGKTESQSFDFDNTKVHLSFSSRF